MIDFNLVKEQVNILEVWDMFGNGSVGKNNKVRCPFHNDKTPSLSFNVEENYFYCFGCGVGGDSIKLVELLTGEGPIEAVKLLGDKFNIELPTNSELKQFKKYRKEKDSLQQIFDEASKYFRSKLTQRQVKWLSTEYGLELETIDKAQIGFYRGKGLLEHLELKGFSEEQILKTGLFTKNKGQIREVFFDNRVIIPYLDKGKPIYFAGRAYNSNNKQAKYLKLNQKGDYVSEYVKNPIFQVNSKKKKSLVITEGEFDALAGYQSAKDFSWVSLGSMNVSKEKLPKLTKLIQNHKKTILINDSGENELQAALKTAEYILSKTGVIINIGLLEGEKGTDIADYCREGKDLLPVIEQSKEFIEYIENDNKLIKIIEDKIKDLEQVDNELMIPRKAARIYRLVSKLDSNYYNPFAEKIREAGKKATGSKSFLGNRREVVRAIKKEGMKSKTGVKEFNPTVFAEKLVAKINKQGDHWAYIPSSEIFYYYNGDKGVWELERKDTRLKGEIRELLRNHSKKLETNNKINEVYSALIQSIIGNKKNAEKFDVGKNPDKQHINLKNGMLDWRTGELKDHSPEYYSIFQLNVEYKPNEDCPLWKEVLRDWINDEKTIKLLQEFAGYCLIPDTSLQKALILQGGGSNGKSTFLETLQAMIGRNNCENKALHEINQRFGTATLQDKLVNICPDIDPAYMEKTAKIKSIITGEEVSAEFKGKDTFNFKPVARLLFSANALPKTRDKSDGWLRRIEIVEFPNKFKPEDDNYIRNLDERLIDELPGIFNWVLEGLRRLDKQGYFTISEDVREAKAEYRKANDTVRAFIDDVCQPNPDKDIPKNYLYRKYKEHCEECNYQAVNSRTFKTTVGNLGFKETRRSKFEICIDHKEYRCEKCRHYGGQTESATTRSFKGIELKD